MNTVAIIIGVVVLLFLSLVFYTRQKYKNLPAIQADESILILTDKNFKHQLKGKLILVDFWAEWCAPCKVMLPILNDVAANNDGSFQVAKVDIDQNKSLAQEYNIRSIPTLVVFDDTKEVARFVGIKNKSFLIKEMKRINEKTH